MEGKDVYILLAFALFRRRRPVLPHRRSPCRFTGDHSVHHVDDALPGLTPSTANFPTLLSSFLELLNVNVVGVNVDAKRQSFRSWDESSCDTGLAFLLDLTPLSNRPSGFVT
jgi:hypothetical protein